MPPYNVTVTEAEHVEWNGIDTLIITAGVSALQPLMTVAGVAASNDGASPLHATVEGINHAVGVAKAALDGNFFGPYIAAITFVRFYILGARSLLRNPPDPPPHILLRITLYSSPLKCSSDHTCTNAHHLRIHQISLPDAVPGSCNRAPPCLIHVHHSWNNRRRLPRFRS